MGLAKTTNMSKLHILLIQFCIKCQCLKKKNYVISSIIIQNTFLKQDQYAAKEMISCCIFFYM